MYSKKFNFLLDTGASVNIIDGNTYDRIKDEAQLEECATRIFSFQGKQPIELLG